MQNFADTDSYIAAQSAELRDRLELIRKCIRVAAPQAEECISYGMPAFKYKGPLVYFAAFKNHIGFFPTGSGVRNFVEELAGYNYSKGTIQLPHNKPIPVALIKKIIKFRVSENDAKAVMKHMKPLSASTTSKTRTVLVSGISAPAQRALEAAGIRTLKGLSKWTDVQLLKLHGIGPKAIPIIRDVLRASGLDLKKT